MIADKKTLNDYLEKLTTLLVTNERTVRIDPRNAVRAGGAVE